jgi:hypothetical protein
MSIDTYELLLETSTIDTAISEAEMELSDGGHLYDAKEALLSLRRKHFG